MNRQHLPPGTQDDHQRLDDPQRVAAVRAWGALGEPDDSPALDRISRLAARALAAPIAAVTVLTAEEQVAWSAGGTDRAQFPTRMRADETACQFVVRSSAPVAIADVRVDPRTRAIPTLAEQDIVAYLAHPVWAADGQILGALCAIDHVPREWTPAEAGVLEDLAELVMVELRLRESLARARQTTALLARSAQTLHEALDAAARVEQRHEDTRAATIHALAHEVRTPLFSIRGIAEVVRDFERTVPEAFRKDLAAIDESALEALESVARRIADTQQDAAVARPRHTRIDVRMLLDGVRAVVAPPVGVQIVVDEPEVAVVLGDPARLGQILRNLLAEALDHVDEGEIRLGAHAVRPDSVAFSVTTALPRGRSVEPDPPSPTDLALAERLTRSLGGQLSCAGRGRMRTAVATLRRGPEDD